MKIYFVRHASKERDGTVNPALGHLDQSISAGGRREARRLVRFFRDRPISRIYVSQYVRTCQTARHLARRFGVEPVRDARLNEIDVGEIELLSDEQIARKYPEFWSAYEAQTADFRFPGGETGEEARLRAAAFLDDLRAAEEDSVAVSHDGLIRILFCHILGLPVYLRFSLKVDTCGIMELAWPAGAARPHLVRFNQKV